jgi:hypothetical protein
VRHWYVFATSFIEPSDEEVCSTPDEPLLKLLRRFVATITGRTSFGIDLASIPYGFKQGSAD